MKNTSIALAVVVAFAVYPTVAPIGLASGSSPFGFVFAAMVVSLVGTSILSSLLRERIVPTRREILGRIALGGLFFIEHICLLFALEYLKVPVAMSLIYTYPLMVALFGIVTNRAAVSRGLFGALSCCLVGVVLVLQLSVEQINWRGVSFALLQAAIAASRILLSSRLAPGSSGLALTTQMLSVGVCVALILACFVSFSIPDTLYGWTVIVVAGLAGVIGHTCTMWALQKMRPARFALVMNLEPVVAMALAALFLDQLLTTPQYVGALLIVASVACYGYEETLAS